MLCGVFCLKIMVKLPLRIFTEKDYKYANKPVGEIMETPSTILWKTKPCGRTHQA